jgi:hypothetical protein
MAIRKDKNTKPKFSIFSNAKWQSDRVIIGNPINRRYRTQKSGCQANL